MATLLLTGATSDIGKDIALKALDHGYNRLILQYAHATNKAAALKEELAAMGAKVELLACDFSDAASVERFQDTILDGGALDAFVHASAYPAHKAPFDTYSNEEIEKSLLVNITAPLKIIRTVVAKMKAQNNGHIVFISSQAGAFGGNKILPYAAAKGALNTMTLGLARELGPYDIRVNAVSPGIIDTKGQAHDLSQVVGSIPLGRLGTPADVTTAVYWLLSDAAAYITGTILPISGGR